MDNKPDGRPVDTHTERDRRHRNLKGTAHKIRQDLIALLRTQASVIG